MSVSHKSTFFLLAFLLVINMTTTISTIKITPIVAPIFQFIVVIKYSSIAVPNVITLLPPISLVNINNDNDGIKMA